MQASSAPSAIPGTFDGCSATASARAMPRLRPLALVLGVWLALPGPATAEIAGPRLDLNQACPDAPTRLNQELTPALKTWGRSGTLDVMFRWDGARATLLHASGAPAEYRPALRRALRVLQCPGARAGEPIRFLLRFNPDLDGR